MAVEKRRHPRFECSGTASIQVSPNESALTGKIADISANGCLILLQEPEKLACDTIVELSFRINDIPIRVWGKVKAARSDGVYGFEFPLLSERVQARIEDLIAQLIEDFLTIRSMRSIGERRRNPRFGCSGKAKVKLSAGEQFYPASIVNISAGGCLLEFEKPQKLERDASVELVFRINNIPFRMSSRVRSKPSETKIGLEFAQLSGRVRRQLDDLIEELIARIVKRLSVPAQTGSPELASE